MMTQLIRVNLRDPRLLLSYERRVQLGELLAVALEQLPPDSTVEETVMAMLNVTHHDAPARKEWIIRTTRRLDTRKRKIQRAGAGLEV